MSAEQWDCFALFQQTAEDANRGFRQLLGSERVLDVVAGWSRVAPNAAAAAAAAPTGGSGDDTYKAAGGIGGRFVFKVRYFNVAKISSGSSQISTASTSATAGGAAGGAGAGGAGEIGSEGDEAVPANKANAVATASGGSLSSSLAAAVIASHAALELFYIQAVRDVLDRHYPCTEQDYFVLAALQVRFIPL